MNTAIAQLQHQGVLKGLLTKGSFTRKQICLKPHIFKKALEKAVFKKNPVHTDTLETTDNDVVPILGMVWHRRFTP